jgi:hypothetical protein
MNTNTEPEQEPAKTWVPIITILHVHPKLRNFLTLNDVPFDSPRDQAGLLNTKRYGLQIVRSSDSADIRLSVNKERVIKLPTHARYYINVLTVESEIIRMEDSEIRLQRAAREAADKFKKNLKAGFSITE